jgi:nitronate monooxygenase
VSAAPIAAAETSRVAVAADAMPAASGLPPLRLAGRAVLPIVQGGMGVGVSAHRLAGAVAAQGASARSPRSTCAATIPT